MNIIEFYQADDFRITSDPRKYSSGVFGLRNYTVNGHNYDSYCDGYHNAVDLSDKHGADVKALGDGLVANGTRDYGTFGGQVCIIYEDLGIQVIYGHVQRPVPVKVGQRVKRGDVIAKQGDTHNQGAGVSMASHLHLQVQHIEALNEKDFTCKGIDPFKIDIDKPKKKKKEKAKVDDKVHLIIAGHGNQRDGSFDPGATGHITKGEHRYVRDDLFPAMKKYLPDGAKAVFYDARKVSNYGNLQAVVNQHNADQVTEIHFDASSASSARRGHVIIHSDYEPDAYDFRLRDAIKSMTGVRYSHKGHQGFSGRNNLYNVNDAMNKGIAYRLIELGFGTNRTDADIMTKNVDEYAEALVEALFMTSDTEAKATVTPSAPVIPKEESTWKRNKYGTLYMHEKGTFTVGGTRIMSRQASPFFEGNRAAPEGGWAYPNWPIRYDELVKWVDRGKNRGYLGIGYTQNGERWYLPIRYWYPNTDTLGPMWGTARLGW